jgi:hypothetical protein
VLAPPVGAVEAVALVVTWGAGGDEVAGAGVDDDGTGTGGDDGGLAGGLAGGVCVWHVQVGIGVGGGVWLQEHVGVGVGGVVWHL